MGIVCQATGQTIFNHGVVGIGRPIVPQGQGEFYLTVAEGLDGFGQGEVRLEGNAELCRVVIAHKNFINGIPDLIGDTVPVGVN